MILDPSKNYLIDLDGTMYRGDQVIEEAVVFVDALSAKGISFLFVTNNAMRTSRQIREKMERMGFQGLKDSLFFTSAMAAALYMKRIQEERAMFCIGEEGLQTALRQAGFYVDEEHAKIVFVGLDRSADYMRYCKAMQLLHQGAILVGTNRDRRLPDKDTYLIGNGAILEMLSYASEAKRIDIGKPSSLMMEETLRYIGKKKEDCIVIGDNLETDIAFGKANGVKTIFMQTGVHTKADIKRFPYEPDVVLTSFAQIIIK